MLSSPPVVDGGVIPQDNVRSVEESCEESQQAEAEAYHARIRVQYAGEGSPGAHRADHHHQPTNTNAEGR